MDCQYADWDASHFDTNGFRPQFSFLYVPYLSLNRKQVRLSTVYRVRLNRTVRCLLIITKCRLDSSIYLNTYKSIKKSSAVSKH